MRRGYFGEAGAQLHYIEAGDVTSETLFLLPPAPNTSVYYEKIIPLLAVQYHIIAIDYPAYGGSDRFGDVSISGYAKAIAPLIKNHSPICLSGFHTGALVANEVALQFPDLVSRLVLIDVPHFDRETQNKYAAGLGTEALPSSVEESFKKTVTHRDKSLSEERAFKIWVENLRSGRYQKDAFRAAFVYDCDAQFAKLTHPLTVITTKSSLLEPSRKTAKTVPHAKLIEMLEITSPVFEAHSETLASAMLKALAS